MTWATAGSWKRLITTVLKSSLARNTWQKHTIKSHCQTPNQMTCFSYIVLLKCIFICNMLVLSWSKTYNHIKATRWQHSLLLATICNQLIMIHAFSAFLSCVKVVHVEESLLSATLYNLGQHLYPSSSLPRPCVPTPHVALIYPRSTCKYGSSSAKSEHHARYKFLAVLRRPYSAKCASSCIVDEAILVSGITFASTPMGRSPVRPNISKRIRDLKQWFRRQEAKDKNSYRPSIGCWQITCLRWLKQFKQSHCVV